MAVICNSQDNIQEYRLLKFRSCMETASSVCDDALDDCVRVSELTISWVLQTRAESCGSGHQQVSTVEFKTPELSLRNTMRPSIWLFKVLLSFCLCGG